MTNNSGSLRIAVVGYGLIGRRRVDAIRRLQTELPVSLKAIVDPVSLATCGEAGATFKRTIDEVDLNSIDAAIIAVPHDVALETVSYITERSQMPILIEKPLGVSTSDADTLRNTLRGTALPSFVGYNYRFLPHVEALLESSASGRLGLLRSVEVCLGHGGSPDDRSTWKVDPTRAGLGVLIDPGVHAFDLVRRLMPSATLRFSSSTRGFWPNDWPEDAAAILQSGQCLATVRVSNIRWVSEFRLAVFGEDGYAIAEGRGGNYGPMTYREGRRWGWLSGLQQADSELRLDFGTSDESFLAETRAVVQAWLGIEIDPGRPSPSTVEEAYETSDLAFRSAVWATQAPSEPE